MLTPAQRKVLEKMRDGWKKTKFLDRYRLEHQTILISIQDFRTLKSRKLIECVKIDNQEYCQLAPAGREALGGVIYEKIGT